MPGHLPSSRMEPGPSFIFIFFILQFFIQGKFQILIYLIFKLLCLQKKNIN